MVRESNDHNVFFAVGLASKPALVGLVVLVFEECKKGDWLFVHRWLQPSLKDRN